VQTQLTSDILNSPQGREADAILRSCVHCGFCTATCPTYALLGDENDSPRGRIYLVKALMEGENCEAVTRKHLDRCLGCRSCETTCPSGVRYGRLLDLGRQHLDDQHPRTWLDQIKRWILRQLLTYPWRFGLLMRLARWIKPVLPKSLAGKVAEISPAGSWPLPRHPRKMLILRGCVQGVLAPSIDLTSAQVLDRLGISLIQVPGSGCCGALGYHLGAHREALKIMRDAIDRCLPYLEQGAEAIVSTASGCGVMLKEYAEVLAHDPQYAEKAAKVSAAVRDIAEVVSLENWRLLQVQTSRIAFHSPCTLQHGQKLTGVVESILVGLGFELTDVAGGHSCCGSAGTYSLLQAQLSHQLLSERSQALEAGNPQQIVTANIGCLSQLQSGTSIPVRHWIELLKPNT
jgi:glycolate oxidase iron-sulfur subunit